MDGMGAIFLQSEFGPSHWTSENWQGVGLSVVAFLFVLILVIWLARPPRSGGGSES